MVDRRVAGALAVGLFFLAVFAPCVPAFFTAVFGPPVVVFGAAGPFAADLLDRVPDGLFAGLLFDPTALPFEAADVPTPEPRPFEPAVLAFVVGVAVAFAAVFFAAAVAEGPAFLVDAPDFVALETFCAATVFFAVAPGPVALESLFTAGCFFAAEALFPVASGPVVVEDLFAAVERLLAAGRFFAAGALFPVAPGPVVVEDLFAVVERLLAAGCFFASGAFAAGFAEADLRVEPFPFACRPFETEPAFDTAAGEPFFAAAPFPEPALPFVLISLPLSYSISLRRFM